MPSQPRQRSHFLFASYYPDNRVFWSFVVVWMVWFSGGCAVVPAHGLPGGGPANQPAVGPVKGEAGPGTGSLAGWPADGWRISTPEEQGLNSALILEMLQEIQKSELDIHSILVVRHGYLVAEVYFSPYQKGLQHPVFSVTKSVTSALVGIAIQEGYIKSVQQKVLDFFRK